MRTKHIALGILSATTATIIGAQSACFAQVANQGSANNMQTINAFLAGIAAHNGMIATNAQYAQVATGAVPVPNVQQALAAVHALPPTVLFGPSTHTPDPTQAELPFVLAGATGAAGETIADPTPGLIFGTITSADESLTGLFDDLANLSQSNDPAATVTGTISTTSLTGTSGTGTLQQTTTDAATAALEALLADTSSQAVQQLQVNGSATNTSLVPVSNNTTGIYQPTTTSTLTLNNPIASAGPSFSAVALHEVIAPAAVQPARSDEIVVDTDEGIEP